MKSRTKWVRIPRNPSALLLGMSLLCFGVSAVDAAGSTDVSFKMSDEAVQITIGEEPFAKYVFRDDEISRPYFCDVYAPGGVEVTRNHPPIEGMDRTDHATYHPGLWLTFGDISGADFWRNRASTRHVDFVEEPRGGEGTGGFAVRNDYLSADTNNVLCSEICRYTLHVRPQGYLLIWDSQFQSTDADFYFGDQEEMGLGVRVATPICVKNGGEILSSSGLKNESQVWGIQADWCDYSGVIQGRRVGVTLMPSPTNFRRSWFHARDYGLLVANSFGQNAFTKGEKSKVFVQKGDTFRLCFGVLVYGVEDDGDLDRDAVYKDFIETHGLTPPCRIDP
ncbi:MAG: PmoA family protein [bacterium]